MAAPKLRSMVFFTAAVVVFLAGLQCATAERTKSALNLRNCDPDGDGKYPSPSVANCPTIVTLIPKGGTVYIYCKKSGGNVYGDPWWLYVQYGKYYGFVSDYYIDCGGVVCKVGNCP